MDMKHELLSRCSVIVKIKLLLEKISQKKETKPYVPYIILHIYIYVFHKTTAV